MRFPLSLASLLLFAFSPVFGAGVDFHRDVAPVLREYCAGCHNEEDRDGEFSVETHAAILKGGESGPVLKAGDPEGSLLLQTVTKRKKPLMPPRKEPQPSSAQIEILRSWVAQGAREPKRDVSILSTLTVPNLPPAEEAPKPVTALAVSPDGKRLAHGSYGAVSIDKKTFSLSPRGKVNDLAFSPDGKLLLAATGTAGLRGAAVLLDVGSGKVLRVFSEGHRDLLYAAAFSPDPKAGLVATAGYDRVIRLWNLDDGKLLRALEGHNGAVYDLAFSPDGKLLASAGGDASVKIWKVATGQRLDTLSQPTGEQFHVAFTADGEHFLAAGADKQIRLWKLLSKNKPRVNPLVRVRYAHEDEVTALAVSPSGRWLATASADLTAKVWSLPDLAHAFTFPDQPDAPSALAYSSDGGALHLARLDGSRHRQQIWPRANPIDLAPTYAIVRVDAPGGKTPAPDEAEPEPEPNRVTEAEPNDLPKQARVIKLPAVVRGVIHKPAPEESAPGAAETPDADLFHFAVEADETWVFETRAARDKSPLDSKLEILHPNGAPVLRERLQAVRESYLTFRGKNSSTIDDFRLFKWDEMSLNQFLYVDGEVVKLWHYPRGPDSGYKVYPGLGSRWGYFDTTPLAHPLGRPAYVVEPLLPHEKPLANGLPVFPLHYENDDEARRAYGKDSKLTFSSSRTASYLVRVSDVRGQQGPEHKYQLIVRKRRPDFKVTLTALSAGVPRGSGREFVVKAERLDDFDGAIRIDFATPPAGLRVTTPVVIQSGQIQAFGALYADADAPDLPEANATLDATATATLAGEEVTRKLKPLGPVNLTPAPKLLVHVVPADGDLPEEPSRDEPLELVIRPGETISARVRATRRDFKDRIALGSHDAGRNLPHGVYVDNVGLNGLLVVEGQTEREFFITCDKWVPETTRLFHLKAAPEKGLVTPPVLLKVRHD